MDTLVGNVVRLEPLATHHGLELFDFKLGTRQPYAVVHNATQKIIGTTSFMDISGHDRTLEIGSTIYARKFWRTAVNTETKLLLLTEAFETQNFLRVTLKTDGENMRSQAALG
jgi:RimJ/RimL family protein N-acetyltransferase